MFLVLSSSLNPNSRSRILGRAALQQLQEQKRETTWFDLVEFPLPICDGATAYGDAHVQKLAELIEQSHGIFIASPVYNYDVNAALKNAIELTGKRWTGKVVSLMLAAGGGVSYMSAMGLANSLMLDFRCHIVPRFVYATGESFEGNELADEDIQTRVNLVVTETLRLADALRNHDA
ncbi:NADPH-dependent FMN reductase [Stieleria varia]|uniref:FMN-dependent NADPH-azoreductase n=1 Tax=Stieleria varia TaxID=2528005 RepID=A0A5C6ANB1_9BACT|nr:NAD(P)H-dependent oxidoreductase [Stieleria varia]TWU00901.1 FMN-dependent NADPH-azoreductase [Stieleria varia]